jgi:hypothetical protein
MTRLIGCLLFAICLLWTISGPLNAQSAFRLPAVLMINFLNRTQQIAYAIGLSDWERLRSEAEGLATEAERYARIVPPGVPLGKRLKDFRKDVDALIRAAQGRDREAVGRSFGRIETGCMTCHKLYRDL